MYLDEKKNFIINFVYFILVASTIYFIYKMTYIYLLPFVVGFFISFLVQKPADFLSEKTILKKQMWAAILSVLIFLTLIFLFALIFWILYSQFISFTDNLNSNAIIAQVENLYNGIKNVINKNNFLTKGTAKLLFADALSNAITKISNILTSAVTDLIKNLPGLLIACVITVVATCYISKDFDKLLSFLKGIISIKIFNRLSELKAVFTDCIFKFLLGYSKLFCLTFIELIIGL
ncbi:MAG: AI-2E family transporter, partial [Clostridia bacterium]|nr:AI-2E family transporter [Clostridia bacterium]